VGQILECPKCRSMVLIAPPPGWAPTAVAAATEVPTSGPPPLDRVADSAVLDLELTGNSWLSAIVGGNVWLLGGVGLTFVVLIVGALGWQWTHATQSEPAVVRADPPAATAMKTAPPPGPQSGGVSTPQAPPVAPSVMPLPVAPPEAKPAKADPPVAKDAAKNATKADKTEEETKQAKQPETKKLPPPPVDVAARMADVLPGIELSDVPLVRAIEILADVSTLPITLDPDAMRLLGVTPRDPISLRLDATTIGRALQAVAARRGLAATVDNGQVIVTLPAEQRETLRTVPYTVSDLTGDEKAAAAELAALLRRLVAPDSWKGGGGRGTVEPKNRVLTVTQSREVHRQVLVFCEKLRNARQKPLRSHDRPEQFTLTTRTGQARAMLDRPVTVNFHEPAPLGKILDFLANATDSDILIDHAALAAAETSDGVETSLTVEKRPLRAVLDELLHPLGLAYRAVGSNVLQVTSAEAADERLELEFYPVGRRLNGANSAAKLVERLKAAVAIPTWNDAGGPGEVYFDAPAQCLIVLQSQPLQAAVERFLAAKGRSGGETGK